MTDRHTRHDENSLRDQSDWDDEDGDEAPEAGMAAPGAGPRINTGAQKPDPVRIPIHPAPGWSPKGPGSGPKPKTPPRPSPEKPKPEPEVGYGRPPKAHRFQAGQSGNPKGRPKGAKNKPPASWGDALADIIRAEAHREIMVREGQASITIPMAQAVMRAVAVNAAKGHARAQRLFLEVVARVEDRDARLYKEWQETVIQYKADAEREIARREKEGLTDVSDIVPHPEDIVIDLQDGSVSFTGPFTAEQKKAWKELVEHRQVMRDLIQSLEDKLACTRSPKKRAEYKDSLARARPRLQEFEAQLPDWKVRD